MAGDVDVTATSMQDLAELSFASNSTSPQPAYWTVPWRIALTLSLAVIMCGAVVGNLLVVVVVLRNRGMRTRTNLFLCNLAVADLLCAVIDMPFSLTTVASGSWIFDDVVCKLNGFALPFLFVASIHTLMYMSIHKYLSLASPFRRSLSTRCVVAMMAGAWLWAAAAGASTVSPLTNVVYKPGTAQCGPRYPSDVATFVHFFVIVVTCYAVPMIAVGVCNALTFAVIRGHGVRMRLHSTEDWRRIGGQQRHIAVTLLLVVVSFAVAWTPWVVYAVYVVFTESREVQPPAIINPITYWCIYLNSVCNPVIYALRSEAFREGYKQVFCTGGKNFASETSSRRSSMTRNCVDKVDGTTSSAAILNNVVAFSADAGGDDRWASLDHYGRRRRHRRLPFWTPADVDDDEEQNDACCYHTTRTLDDEVPDADVGRQETAPSLTPVTAVVEDFDDSSTEQSPVAGRVCPLSQDSGQTLADSALFQQKDITKSDRTKTATAALTLSSEYGPFSSTGNSSSALAARASSVGDVLSGVEAPGVAAGRSSRLLSCASALFGRFVTRQRLTTVSGAECRHRRDVALKKQYSSSSSFHDAPATSTDCERLSRKFGTQTVSAAPADDDDDPDRMTTTPRQLRQLSLSGSVESNSSRQRSQRHVASTPTAARPAGGDTITLDVPATAGATLDHEALQRTRSSKKRPAVRRYPSVERLDLPRRRSAAATTTLVGADHKRAERFQRQYIDVKLRRQATPLELTQTAKSMPTGVDVCGRPMTRHDVIAGPQLLPVPATADVTLT